MFINKSSPSRSIGSSASFCPFAPTTIIIALRPRDCSAPSRQRRSQGGWGFGGYASLGEPWGPLRGLRRERPPRVLQRALERVPKAPVRAPKRPERATKGPLGPLKSQICVKTVRRTKMGPFQNFKHSLKLAVGLLRSGLGPSRYEMGPLHSVMGLSGLGWAFSGPGRGPLFQEWTFSYL